MSKAAEKDPTGTEQELKDYLAEYEETGDPQFTTSDGKKTIMEMAKMTEDAVFTAPSSITPAQEYVRTKSEIAGKFAMVTNSHRGIYFGRVSEDYCDGDPVVKLTEAKIIFFWVARTGIGCLPVTGPEPGSKVSPEMLRMTINDVACVFLCTDAAAARWKAQGWDDDE